MDYERLINLGAVIVGAATLVAMLVRYLRWRRVRSWHQMSIEVEHRGVGWKWLHMWPGRLKNYGPDIRYVYLVDGKRYMGSRVTVRDECISSVDEGEIQELVRTVASGSTAFVNPNRPEESYLVCQMGKRHWDHLLTYSCIGALLLLFGVYFW